jgi:hypothetical protein
MHINRSVDSATVSKISADDDPEPFHEVDDQLWELSELKLLGLQVEAASSDLCDAAGSCCMLAVRWTA